MLPNQSSFRFRHGLDYILSPIVICVSYRTSFLGMLVLYLFTQKPLDGRITFQFRRHTVITLQTITGDFQ
jgi:hypothetical protein